MNFRIIVLIIVLSIFTSCNRAVDEQNENNNISQNIVESDKESEKLDIPLEYEDARGFSDGLSAVKLNGKWGYIDYNNNLIIPFEYDYMRISPTSNYENFIGAFKDGLCPVIKDGKVGYINKQNEVIIPFIYDYGYNFSGGLAKVYNENEGYGYIDESGNIVIPLIYDYANDFNEGLASVKINDYFGYIDKNGNEIIEFKFKNASSFSDGFAVVTENDETYKYIDKAGNYMFNSEFKTANNFNDGYAVVENHDTEFNESVFSVIDKNGNIILNTKDYYFTAICEGLISAQSITQNENEINFGNSGYLDLELNEIIPFEYSITTDFSGGLGGIVNKNQKLGFIDKTGKIVIDNIYDFEYETDNVNISESFVVVHRDGKYGFLSSSK